MVNSKGDFKPWTKQQKRVFNRLISWCYEAKSRNCQISRIDLTTADNGPAHLLRRHLQELRRRVERDLGYKGVETFVVETSEGNGVLHMVWAWAGDRPFIIDQGWLSEQWDTIHGAYIVYIQRMNLGNNSIRRVGRYFALQYLADQRGALVRMSWSWKRARVAIGKGWKFMVRMLRLVRHDVHYAYKFDREMPDVTFQDLLVSWEEVLTEGSTVIGGRLLEVRERQIVELF